MSKFFIVFLTLFAIVGIGYRLHVNSTVQVTPTLVTYTDDELGFTLKHLEDAPLTIGDPVIIPPGARPIDTMASTTFLDPSGLNPKPSEFVKEITQHTTVYYIQTSQFEGVVSYDGYLVKDNFIIPVRYVWSGVDWTNPEYNSTKDPKFTEFMDVLRSVEFIHVEKGIYEGIEQGV